MWVGNYWALIAIPLLSVYLCTRNKCRPFKAVLVALCLVFVLKFLVGRSRPGLSKDWDAYQSFPSGHSAVAFAFAASVNVAPFLRTLVYVLAVVTAISRVYHRKHWGTDVLVGSALGYGVGRIV
jgi:membrane-associated phospholipid phosphatase